jgi:DNA polymerase (family X)
LKDSNIRRAKEEGVKMIINTDSHNKNSLKLMKLGVYQARRGWAEKKDIINTSSLDKLLSYLK